MIGDLSNHLWQSTVFAVAAALLAAALRKNGAHIRHLVWLTASLKFLVPFSLLMSLGSQWTLVRPAVPGADAPAIETVSVVMDEIAQPFTDVFPSATAAPRSAVDWVPIAMLTVWACGFAAIALWRLRAWRRIRAAVQSSTALQLPISDSRSAIADYRFPIAVLSCPGLLEPGIVGFFRPVMLVPAGIEHHLTPKQLDAVLAHELCHVRRRDNLTSAIHMVVEAVFWFHPLVWWIGARMVDERERACDEHVLRVLGKPEAYAEGILNVCKLYVESPLTCVSGVTGANLKQRIEAIMVNRIGLQLNFARRTAIASAALFALVAPIVIGMITAPIRTAAQAAAGGAQFEVVSIKPCAAETALAGVAPPAPAGARRGGAGGWQAQTTPGRVYWDCVTLTSLVDQAYADRDHPLLNTTGNAQPPRADGLGPTHPRRVRGGPSWVESDKFTIEAKAPVALTTAALAGSTGRNLANLPLDMSLALRAVLEDRFQVKVHRVTEPQDMYALMVADGGPNKTTVTTPVPGDCVTRERYFELIASASPPRSIAEAEAGPRICGGLFSTMTGMEYSSATLSQLAGQLSTSMDLYVLDRTGIDTKLNFKLWFRSGSGDTADQRVEAGLALLGLRFQSIKAPAEYFVIDRAERPRPDLPAAASSKMFLPILATAISTGTSAFARDQAMADKQKFDVASVKPCGPDAPAQGPGRGNSPGNQASPGYLNLSCLTLRQLVSRAYLYNQEDHLRNRKWEEQFVPGSSAFIRGGPSWVTADRFTIEARAEGVMDPKTLSGPMLRALLEDRFQLKTHRATEERAMYALTITKTGLTIKPTPSGECWEHEPGQPVPPHDKDAGPCGGMSGDGWGTYQAHGVILGDTARASQRFVDELWGLMLQPVIDRTGLNARYSFAFDFTPDENTPGVDGQCGGNADCMAGFVARGQSDARPANFKSSDTIFKALERLGLNLEQTKAPAEYLVIDSAERPRPDAPAPAPPARTKGARGGQ